MSTLSIDFSSKLKAMRKTEKMTQQRFSDITGIALSTIKKYESGNQPARADIAVRVTQCNLFKKYTMWLLHDEPVPGVGQISPALSLDGSNHSEVDQVSTKTTQKSHR
ncbi:helix-turn-helix transcriptional regulator [Salmonella enterica subsp. diarizonae serovar 16:z10:e,n,x,z15]|uniref:helix-turn-helix domain-containing protein n=1 Tax=Salmonella enterica TaxID=28901 RepID=UPI001F0EA7F8|nr:helix-turn-helix transcriptional regulator [Salmonella enterica subsp. diarizonae serovar 16:z10:e,n,x,z15]MCH5505350.1 helix-turn-helix transcriptional regulator [Salmonella enterica subsp. diarizonae serovar 16:z10:e,n,x,z15]